MSSAWKVRPALGSRRALYGSAVALSGLLLSPLWVGRLLSDHTDAVFRSMPLSYVYYRWIGDELARPEPIDVLFVGDSGLLTAVHAALAEELLTEAMARPVTVRSFAADWRGEESYYLFGREVLKRRPVRLMVWTEVPRSSAPVPHPLAHFFWLQSPENFALDVPLAYKARLYGASMLGVPRHLHLWLRGRRAPESAGSEALARLARNRGFLESRQGWKSLYGTAAELPFEELAAPDVPAPGPALVAMEGEPGPRLAGPGYDPVTTRFVRLLKAECDARETRFASLVMPRWFRDRRIDSVDLQRLSDGPRDWPVIGLTHEQLFPGRDFDAIRKHYYYNENHFNLNGARQVTRSLAPVLEALLHAP